MPPLTVTDVLKSLRQGDEEALDQLIPLVYEELRGLARQQLRRERDAHTLNTTALVNEAYLKLAKQHGLQPDDRTQFLAIAATTMRRLLVDYARMKKRAKRGGGAKPVPLEDELPFLTETEADEVLALDEALTRLEAINPRSSQVVQYRFFGGLTNDEAADALQVSSKTVQRSWIAARAWLRKEVQLALLD